MASKGDINKSEIQPSLFSKWEVLKLEETIENSGKFIKLKSKEYFESGKYPVVDQGDKTISGYVNE